MILPKITDFDFRGKRVLVRCDFDVPLDKEQEKVEDDSRIKECLPTVQYLLDHAARVILIGHLGRPEGSVVERLRLMPVAKKIQQLLEVNAKAQMLNANVKCQNFECYQVEENIILLENLRFYPGEEENDPQFAKDLSSLADVYVNEAFASSHRAHSSIVGVPKLLPHFAGLHFIKEAENLSRVLENPKKPLIFVVGGAKPETKLPLAVEFGKIADFVLIGGKLAGEGKEEGKGNEIFASLTADGFDIDEQSIGKFRGIIAGAGTVVWNGPMGKFEEERWEAGTKAIAQAVADSSAYKLVGGGDTIAALTKFNLIGKMDYVSTAGGAMLEFLAKGTLPGIEALLAE